MRKWLILLPLTLLAATAWASVATPKLTQAQMDIATRYSIDPQKEYPGYSVIQAIDLILTNAEAEAKERATAAWEAGYKAAVEQYAPEVAGLEAERDRLMLQIASLTAELESAKAMGIWGAAGSGVGGAALGFLLGRASR